VVLTRQQMYGLGHRPATIEHVGLGAKPDGTLDAVVHEATAITSRYEDFARNDSGWAEQLYKSPNGRYSHKLVRLDVSTPCDMRAPGAASGVCALECAMDELAVALKLDPIELLRKCYSDRDQSEDLPYTSKQLRNATPAARKPSAGAAVIPRRARCATVRNWSAGAWRQACGRHCRCRSQAASC
jgi:xanthine dehydrogenase YagR molybdenum-binding subunit